MTEIRKSKLENRSQFRISSFDFRRSVAGHFLFDLGLRIPSLGKVWNAQ
jgi:hypothetical protein